MVLSVAGEVSIQMEGIKAHFNTSASRYSILKPPTLLLLPTIHFPILYVNNMFLFTLTTVQTPYETLPWQKHLIKNKRQQIQQARRTTMKVRSFFFTCQLRSHTIHWRISMGNIFSTAWNKHGWWSTNTSSLRMENVLKVFLFLLELPSFFFFLPVSYLDNLHFCMSPFWTTKKKGWKEDCSTSTCPVWTPANRGWHWWLKLPSLRDLSWTKQSSTTLTPLNSSAKFSPTFTGTKRLDEQMLQDQNLTY